MGSPKAIPFKLAFKRSGANSNSRISFSVGELQKGHACKMPALRITVTIITNLTPHLAKKLATLSFNVSEIYKL